MKTQTTKNEAGSTRSVSLVVVYVSLGAKKINALSNYCGNLITSMVKRDGKWELAALRKNAEKLLKRIVDFFHKEKISLETKGGLSRVVFPFKDILTKRRRKSLGLEITPIGLVFSKCADAVKESLIPPIPEEDKAFREWDIVIDGLLASFTEKKQYVARKWLEMTEPVVRNSEA